MNHCAIQQNSFTSRNEMRNSVSDVVCPKPRRVGLRNAALKPLRLNFSQKEEISDSKAGRDVLDIILTKDDFDLDQGSTQVDSSLPFFCGSPPSRVANPLIHDSRFGDEKFSPFSPPSPPSSPSSSARKGGCVRANFGNNPAVRIEGFDCLDRDRRNCSIPALA